MTEDRIIDLFLRLDRIANALEAIARNKEPNFDTNAPFREWQTAKRELNQRRQKEAQQTASKDS